MGQHKLLDNPPTAHMPGPGITIDGETWIENNLQL